jgi:hypothetical protein
MTRSMVHRTSKTPPAGSEVFISPAAGVHGHGSFWALLVSSTDGLVPGHAYVRVCRTEDVDGDATVRTFYVRLSGLLVRDPSR